MTITSVSERTRLIRQSNDGKYYEDDAIPSPEGKSSKTFVWIAVLAFLAATILILFGIGKYSYHQLNTHVVKSGTRVQLQLVDGYFVRVADDLIATEAIPWLAGSTFEVELGPKECWRLKSLKTNKWVSYSIGSRDYFSATVSDSMDALCFKVYRLPDDDTHMSLRVTGDDMWVSTIDLPDSTVGITVSASKEGKAVFQINTVNRLVGVNLGGWFIPEVWMTPSFFNGTGLGWAGSLCRMRNYSRDLTEQRMRHTLNTWITESDIAHIAQLGFNTIRLPVGYWNLIDDPYDRYSPSNVSESLRVIDWAFSAAERQGLSVLLDLHGGPGSQNGIDHSGCSMDPQWTSAANLELSLAAVKVMAERYSNRPNLLGVELLNEPSLAIETNSHDILLAYYEQSYEIIRKESATALVVFNELYGEFYGAWKGALQEPDFYNVAVDWHLYDWQEPFTSENISEHIRDAERWTATISEYAHIHPILVGEWTMSTGVVVQAGQPFVDACLRSFATSLGSYAWNWKVQSGIGFDEWDVQRQSQLTDGLNIIPPPLED